MDAVNLKYLTDENGERTAVVIQMSDWLAIQEELSLVRQQESIKQQLISGFADVKLYKSGAKELMTLEDCLKNEL
ncbi:MAG: hypothetical protein AAF798_08475 [Bacteroidota bacterium]